jgi:hypothetical protein
VLAHRPRQRVGHVDSVPGSLVRPAIGFARMHASDRATASLASEVAGKSGLPVAPSSSDFPHQDLGTRAMHPSGD